MKRKNREQPEAGIDMTPMIDMVFLLLVFFMCAATLSKVDFTPEIKLPVAPKAQIPEDLRNRGTVNILPPGTVTPGGETVTAEKPFLIHGSVVGEKELERQMADLRKDRPDLRVYLRIDRDTEFALVRRAIKACAQAGIFDVVFGSYQSNPGE
jgi:biopolymer transport protein ExbD